MRADLLLACALCVLRATTNGVVEWRWGAVVELFRHDTVLKTMLSGEGDLSDFFLDQEHRRNVVELFDVRFRDGKTPSSRDASDGDTGGTLSLRMHRTIYPVTEATNCRNNFALHISACMTRRLCAHLLCRASACMTMPVCTPPLLRTGLDSVRSDDEQMTIKAKVSHGMECAQDVPLTLDVLRQLDLWDDVENCCRYGRRVVIKMPQQSDEETEGTLSSARKRKM